MIAIWLLASATGLPQTAPETAPAPFFDEDTGRLLTITPGEGAWVEQPSGRAFSAFVVNSLGFPA